MAGLSADGHATHAWPHWTRWALLTVGAGVALAASASLCVTSVPECGPLLANGLRTVIGRSAVTFLEERVAWLDDHRKRLVRSERQPRAIRDVQALAPTASGHLAPVATERVFQLAELTPPFVEVAAPGDGTWRPLPDPERPDAPAIVLQTMLHPDRRRSWAELFVIATEAARVQVFAVAGTAEPESSTPEGERYLRRARIAPEHEPALLFAFNGGFKAEHGRHGMMVEGVVLLPAKRGRCTVLGRGDGTLRVFSWPPKAGDSSDMDASWWRQTPDCLVEHGRINPALNDKATKWGATLEGETVIRRSAIGLDASGKVLYVAISNSTTAYALAFGMQHAGAANAAQLDVNWSYPKILVFPRAASGRRTAQSVFKGFVFRPDDYVARPSSRDFFYVIRRANDVR